MGAPIPLKLEPVAATTQPSDRRGRALSDLRISIIDRCNFRCPYCMPEELYPRDHQFLRKAERLDFEEIERLVAIFAGLGVRKLRLTGGEPLLRRDLPQLVRRLVGVAGIDDVALTTNGSLLAPLAQTLRDAGLQRITLSFDSIVPLTFRTMSGGRGDVEMVLAAIAAAERAGFTPLKINCVVMRGGNDGEVLELLNHFRGSGHIVRFIEYMDVGTCNGWQRELVVPSAELRARIGARWPLHDLAPNYGGEVATRCAFADGGGEIGFISSVTEPFCGDCTRARLSADGRLYTCLFANAGHDLRGPLRAGASDADMAGLIRTVWSSRDDRYSELRSDTGSMSRDHVEMYTIGG